MSDKTYVKERLASLPESQSAAIKAAGLTIPQQRTTLQILEYQDDENYPNEYLGTVYCECGPHKPYSARTLDSLRKRGIIEMYNGQTRLNEAPYKLRPSCKAKPHGVYFCRVVDPKIREEDFGGDDSDGYSLGKIEPDEQNAKLAQSAARDSIIPVIQQLDQKVQFYRGGTLYPLDFLENCSYARLVELRDDLIQRYNQALAEEDRANGETVRLNGLSGEFQVVDGEDNLVILDELIRDAQKDYDHWDKDSPVLAMAPKHAEEVKAGARWSRHLKEAELKLYALKLARAKLGPRKEEN